jgi:hypothetical protein
VAPEPEMEARPPALADAVVRALIPPACREAVIGDLWERYRSPAAYVHEALRALPFLVFSRIRRTTNATLLAIAFLMLLASFGRMGQPWLAAAVPALAVLIAFVMRDVYRNDHIAPLRRMTGDAVAVAALVLLSQAVLAGVRPDLTLAPAQALIGAGMCLCLLVARLVTPQTNFQRLQFVAGAVVSLDELRREIRQAQHSARATRLVETGAGVLNIAGALAGAWFAPEPFVKAALGLTAAGAAFVIVYLHRHAMRPLPMDRDSLETRTAYRAELVRGERLLRRVWLWYLVPLAIGPVALIAGWALTQARPLARVGAVLASMAVATLLVERLNRSGATAIARRIDALDRTDERE